MFCFSELLEKRNPVKLDYLCKLPGKCSLFLQYHKQLCQLMKLNVKTICILDNISLQGCQGVEVIVRKFGMIILNLRGEERLYSEYDGNNIESLIDIRICSLKFSPVIRRHAWSFVVTRYKF